MPYRVIYSDLADVEQAINRLGDITTPNDRILLASEISRNLIGIRKQIARLTYREDDEIVSLIQRAIRNVVNAAKAVGGSAEPYCRAAVNDLQYLRRRLSIFSAE